MESRETEDRIDNLVICSTLNQITNYLIIKKYKPKTIYNITFSDETSVNITPEDWDERLFNTINDKSNSLADYKPNRIDVKLTNDVISLNSKLKDKLKKEINTKEGEITYWNITGGQRIISIAISEILKEDKRVNDKYLYVEGNSEKLYINAYEDNESQDAKEVMCNELDLESYGNSELDIETALKLVGIKPGKIKSESILKTNTKINDLGEELNKNEFAFYDWMYDKCCDKKTKYSLKLKNLKSLSKKQYDDDFFVDTFRNLLLKSNLFSNKKGKNTISDRSQIVKALFDELSKTEENKHIFELFNEKFIDLDTSTPAGYILEKLAAYQIYKLTEKNTHVVDLRTSLKTQFDSEEKKYGNVDELDIVLLTDTGKIINFECKSGGMDGDNAKSTNYTTYRLAGVFGMPVLISPLYEGESIMKNEFLKKQFSAICSAKKAELTVINIDKINDGLGKLGI